MFVRDSGLKLQFLPKSFNPTDVHTKVECCGSEIFIWFLHIVGDEIVTHVVYLGRLFSSLEELRKLLVIITKDELKP